VGKHSRSRCRTRRGQRQSWVELARHVVPDGRGGGAVAFRYRGELAVARWHRTEDRDRVIARALEILVDGDDLQGTG
jgi:hypothetical protein